MRRGFGLSDPGETQREHDYRTFGVPYSGGREMVGAPNAIKTSDVRLAETGVAVGESELSDVKEDDMADEGLPHDAAEEDIYNANEGKAPGELLAEKKTPQFPFPMPMLDTQRTFSIKLHFAMPYDWLRELASAVSSHEFLPYTIELHPDRIEHAVRGLVDMTTHGYHVAPVEITLTHASTLGLPIDVAVNLYSRVGTTQGEREWFTANGVSVYGPSDMLYGELLPRNSSFIQGSRVVYTANRRKLHSDVVRRWGAVDLNEMRQEMAENTIGNFVAVPAPKGALNSTSGLHWLVMRNHWPLVYSVAEDPDYSVYPENNFRPYFTEQMGQRKLHVPRTAVEALLDSLDEKVAKGSLFMNLRKLSLKVFPLHKNGWDGLHSHLQQMQRDADTVGHAQNMTTMPKRATDEPLQFSVEVSIRFIIVKRSAA